MSGCYLSSSNISQNAPLSNLSESRPRARPLIHEISILTMAEAFAALGIAASIVTFVEVSGKVLARLREFRSAGREIPGVFQDITTQLPLITDILTQIKEFDDGSLTRDAQHALLHVVEGCLRQATLLNELIEKILPASTTPQCDEPGRRLQAFAKRRILR